MESYGHSFFEFLHKEYQECGVYHLKPEEFEKNVEILREIKERWKMLEWLSRYTKVKSELMKDIRREWSDRVSISKIPKFEKKRAESFVKNFYSRMQLEEPKIIICKSPLEAQLKSSEIPQPVVTQNTLNSAQLRAWEDLWNRMTKTFNKEMGKPLPKKDVHNLTRAQRIKGTVRQAMNPPATDENNPIHMTEIRRLAERQTRINLEEEGHESLVNPVDVVDPSWAMYYQFMVGADIIEPEPGLDAYMDGMLCGMFNMIPFWNTCFITKPPKYVSLNEDNRIHNSLGYSIEFPDKYGLHFLHGVYIHPGLYKQFEELSISAKEIIKMQNVEQRMALIKELGYEYILKEVKAKVVDRYKGRSKITKKPVKYELIEFSMESNRGWGPQMQDFRLIKVEDHTTHKEVLIGVPREDSTKTCIGAIAWTFNMTEKEYKPFLES